MPSLSIDLPFANGVYTFALYGPQIDEIQRKCGIGIGGLLGRLLTGVYADPKTGELVEVDPLGGMWHDADIVEVIRQGLIGGKQGVVDGQTVQVSSIRANELIASYVTSQPRKANWLVAAAVVKALIEGYEPPRPPQPAGQKRRTRKAKSTSPSS